MRTLTNGLRPLLRLFVLCASVVSVRCGDDDDANFPKTRVISEVSFEVTGWIFDEFCWLDCLEYYAVSLGEVNEANDSGIVVPIFLSRPASGDGKFYISYQDSLYGRAFTTIPVPSPEGFIEFPIMKGEMIRSFKVFPIDNNEHTNGFKTKFNIGNITGPLREGASQEYVLTIIDDEN